MQDCSNSSSLAMELPKSNTEPTTCTCKQSKKHVVPTVHEKTVLISNTNWKYILDLLQFNFLQWSWPIHMCREFTQ